MRTKPLILLAISIGCGLIASFAVSQVMNEGGNNNSATTGVLVLAKDVSPMSKMTAEMFRVEQWPVDRIPTGALTDPKEVEGKYAKQRLYLGEPLIEAKVSAKGKDLIVPVGYRIFDVKVDDTNGGSGYICPGDRVDITGFFEAGNRFPVSKSIRIMRNIEVAMVDGVSFQEPEATPKKASTIQLLVLEKQYEVLDTASNLGKLKLSLRAPEASEVAAAQVNPDIGDSFMEWLKKSERKSEVAKSTSNSLSMLKGIFAAVTPKPQPDERKEMLIITPGSVSIYRWVNGSKVPILMSPESYSSYGGMNPQGTSSSDFPYSESNTGASGTSNSATSSNASQPSAKWDPKTGTWQTGGFTPTYPQSK
jgi:pilus assembly protein CpaB